MEAQEWKLKFPSDMAPRRLDLFLSDALRESGFSREKLKKAIRQGNCRVDKHPVLKGDAKVFPGQEICFSMLPSSSELHAESGELEILYQDQYIAVINKPTGITTHPAPSCPEGTLVHRLLAHFPQLKEQEGVRPGIVHRLDKDTSGLLCIALTEESRLLLAEAIANRVIKKEYLAIVHGNPAPQGEIKSAIGRDSASKIKMAVHKNGKPAWTEWESLYQGKNYALLAIKIHTGRTHQIRVHMSSIGYPLLGDSVYGDKKKDEALVPRLTAEESSHILSRQMLHAWKLSFAHPITDSPMSFRCPPPADFLDVAKCIEKRMQRVVITGIAGSGKSFFTRTFAELGIPTWSADATVIQLYEPNKDGWQLLKQRYGERFISDTKSPVNRRELAKALLPFGNSPPEVDVRELNALLHPAITANLNQFWQLQEKQGKSIAIAEVPLWHESGAGKTDITEENQSPFVVCVTCNEEERRRRLLEERGWSEAFLTQAEAMQWSQTQKAQLCDYIVTNTGTIDDLRSKTEALLRYLEEKQRQQQESFIQKWKSLFASATPSYRCVTEKD